MWITLFISVPALVAAAISGLVVVWHSPVDTVPFEFAKALMQVLLVVLVGAVLSFVSKLFQSGQDEVALTREHERIADEYKREVLSSVLGRATTAYNGVKRTRRLLRARARSRDGVRTRIVVSFYDEYMTRLNDIQLEFESLRAEVGTPLGAQVFSGVDALSGLFRDLEEYLGKLVTEYETERPRMARATASPRRLFVLQKFLGRGDFDRFSTPYHDVRSRLRQDLATNRSAAVRPRGGASASPTGPPRRHGEAARRSISRDDEGLIGRGKHRGETTSSFRTMKSPERS